jgi:hypothetical protein
LSATTELPLVESVGAFIVGRGTAATGKIGFGDFVLSENKFTVAVEDEAEIRDELAMGCGWIAVLGFEVDPEECMAS